jgi:hypothetical protein
MTREREREREKERKRERGKRKGYSFTIVDGTCIVLSLEFAEG